MKTTRTAGEIKVGDVVEFEPGCPVRVTEVSPSYGPGDFDPTSALVLAELGPLLSFACIVADAHEGTPLEVHTGYSRRALSINIARAGG